MANWAQLGALTSSLIPLVAKEGSQAYNFSQGQADFYQEALRQQAIKDAEKEAEKKKKGALGGKIGAALGSIAGLAAAPFTGGASLAIPAALAAGGGAVGSTAGQFIGGGEVDPASVMMSGIEGGVLGLGSGMSAPAKAADGATIAAQAQPKTYTELVADAANPALPVVDPVGTGTVLAPAKDAVSPLTKVAKVAIPAAIGNRAYMNQFQPISGPAPARTQTSSPSVRMAKLSTGAEDMSARDWRKAFRENDVQASVQLQQYLDSGGSLDPNTAMRMGRTGRQYLEQQGYTVPSRGRAMLSSVAGAVAPSIASRLQQDEEGNWNYTPPSRLF